MGRKGGGRGIQAQLAEINPTILGAFFEGGNEMCGGKFLSFFFW